MSYIIEKINSPNQSSRGSYKPELIVCHIADGTYQGTKAWFQNSTSQTSSNYVIGQNGEICECVPLDKMAWCNGTTTNVADSRYFGNSTVALIKQKGGNANQYSVSIECEGYYSKTKGALTNNQFDALVWLIKKIQSDVKSKYGIVIPFDRKHIVGHYEVNPKTKPNCPGPDFPWDSLIKKLGGTTTVSNSSSTIYRVQVGSFARKSNADNFLLNVKSSGYLDSFITQDDNENYKVQVGAFTLKTNAENYMNEIKAKGYDAFIVAVTK